MVGGAALSPRPPPLSMGLPQQVAVAVDRARGHEADDAAPLIHHRIAAVRHTDALLIETEPGYLSLTLGLLAQESGAADEPRLVGLNVGTEASGPDAPAPRA